MLQISVYRKLHTRCLFDQPCNTPLHLVTTHTERCTSLETAQIAFVCGNYSKTSTVTQIMNTMSWDALETCSPEGLSPVSEFIVIGHRWYVHLRIHSQIKNNKNQLHPVPEVSLPQMHTLWNMLPKPAIVAITVGNFQVVAHPVICWMSGLPWILNCTLLSVNTWICSNLDTNGVQ